MTCRMRSCPSAPFAPLFSAVVKSRRPGVGRDPQETWIPAFAGMTETTKVLRLHLLDQLHLGAIGRLDESDVTAVVELLQHDVRAIAAQFGDRAGIVVGLHRDVFDPHHLLAVLGRADRCDVELQPVQVELDVAVRGLVLQRGPEIIDVELGGFLGVVRLDVDVPDFHGHDVLLAGSRCARREPSRGSLAARSGELNPKLKRDRGYETMTVARELAEFLIRTSPSDIPRQPLEHAAMLIASTLASAALGSGLQSSRIIRDLARERGGRPDASLWFSSGPKLPMAEVAQVNAVASDAAASDDSDLRNIVHAGTTLAATGLAVAERTGTGGEEVLR